LVLRVLVRVKRVVVLGGEVAVPCNPQAAIAGLNSLAEASSG